MSNLGWRLLTAFLLLPLALYLGYLGGWPFLSLIILFGGVALLELDNLLGLDLLIDKILTFLFYLPLLFTLHFNFSLSIEEIMILSFILVVTLFLLSGGKRRSERITAIIFAPFYLGFLLRYFYLLRNQPQGFYLLLLFMLGTFASDSLAYFVGKFWGRRKIFPTISPGKTLEGTIISPLGGIIGTVFTALIFSQPLLPVIPLGVLISAFALLGDLLESIFKREAGVKDSSNLLPGHGGFLDRLDSLLMTAPLVFFYAMYIIKV